MGPHTDHLDDPLFVEHSIDESMLDVVRREDAPARSPTGFSQVGGCVIPPPGRSGDSDWVGRRSRWSSTWRQSYVILYVKSIGAALMQRRSIAVGRSDAIVKSRSAGTSRTFVTDAVNGERGCPALEAGHIKAHSDDQPNRPVTSLYLGKHGSESGQLTARKRSIEIKSRSPLP